jgi:hypothetical protein
VVQLVGDDGVLRAQQLHKNKHVIEGRDNGRARLGLFTVCFSLPRCR